MCGIVGMVSLNGRPVDTAALQRMNDLQSHRGPDGEGFVLGWADAGRFQHAFMQKLAQWQPAATPRVALGHRRLAILDLSDRGLQPMSGADASTWIVFNGEIYNHAALRRELETAGHVYRTHSDTETIVHAYEQWGDECVHRFRGMFAFALYDRNRETLFAILEPELAGARVLDLACGEGYLSRYLAPLGPQTINAVDLSERLIEVETIEAEMDRLLRQLGFTGGTLQQRVEALNASMMPKGDDPRSVLIAQVADAMRDVVERERFARKAAGNFSGPHACRFRRRARAGHAPDAR